MTLYDKIMQDAKPETLYFVTPRAFYTICMVCNAVRKCTAKALEGCERSKISEEAIETIAFCDKIMRLFHTVTNKCSSDLCREGSYRFTEYEIRMMLKIVEGCDYCGDRVRCKQTRFLSKDSEEIIRLAGLKLTGLTGLNRKATIKYLRKLVEEINEHNNNEVSTLGSR